MFVSMRRRSNGSDGFTLIELVVAITIMGVVMVSLTGVVLAYFQHTRTTAARLNESAAMEFVAAYWQRDVSSIGVRSTTYNTTTHTFTSQNSVNVTLPSGCTAAAGTKLITLAWNEYTFTSPNSPTLDTVTYYANGATLARVRCSGGNVTSSTALSSRLSGTPSVSCDGGTCASLTSPPNVITMNLTVLDTTNDQAGAHPYNVVLTGDRRQSS
ncbi:MAG: hypothetical protein JWR52_3361 [Marmoricola sp.]|nr:hypothetical protein [Marmoricola sp.]